jgi:LPXTG-motif cell wall-anchored protein
VLTSSVGPLRELPATGPASNAGLLTLIGGFLLLVGATLRKLGRQVGRR